MAVEYDGLTLPPGFRFHPTDEEIITHYLSPKVLNQSFKARAMGEVDLNKCEPWDLPGKAKMREKDWYFFCQRDRKYPTGMRTNRATNLGYWKATGKDKEIYRAGTVLVGMKKTLVFYRGRAPRGEKTNWVMHEFRQEGKFPLSDFPRPAKDEWVVCRVFCKNTVLKRTPNHSDLSESPALPPLMDTSYSFINSGDGEFGFGEYWVSDPCSSSGYLEADNSYLDMMQSHCNAAQFSNQSMLSQETGGISAEISSGDANRRWIAPASSTIAGVLDLRSMWGC